jgi:hypothetical protein
MNTKKGKDKKKSVPVSPALYHGIFHLDWIQVFIESVLFIYVFFGVLVCPCQLFVRLRYRVSDVLDLSLVSKRFGFWSHITHVIVLTFKEIKHLSDCRIIGLSNCRSIGLSDRRTIGLSDCRIIGRTPLISVQGGAGSCVNIHIIVLAVNITFLFLITCPNRILTKERSRTSETRYHRRTNNWQGHTRTKKKPHI